MENIAKISKGFSEKEIENSILQYLHARRIFAWKNNTTGTYDPVRKVFRKAKSKFLINGVSDILGILPCGTFLAIEVKKLKPKTYPTKLQKLFIENINNNGGLAFVARSIIDVEEELEKWKLGRK